MAKRILHVEDDEDTSNMVRMLLKTRGYDVLSAFNGAEGLKLLAENPVDLVLLDVMLPDTSGWDIFGKIKKNPENKDLKVAFLSVIPVSEERFAVFQKSGVSDYITKPFDNEDLLRRVKTMLGE
jgi:DNA-binding response OmpR family regulator